MARNPAGRGRGGGLSFGRTAFSGYFRRPVRNTPAPRTTGGRLRLPRPATRAGECAGQEELSGGLGLGGFRVALVFLGRFRLAALGRTRHLVG